MAAELQVRKATVGDAPAVAEIGRTAFGPTYADSLDPAVIDTVVRALYADDAVSAQIDAAGRQSASRFLVVENVVESKGRVDGFLHYDELGPEPELHRLYLRPDAIGTGAGSALMRGLHDRLPAGQQYVLMVAASNTRAIAFYRHHGLAVRESVDGVEYYRTHMGVEIAADAQPYPAYIMARS